MNNQKVVCPLCQFSENLPTAKNCELCGSSLKATANRKPNSFKIRTNPSLNYSPSLFTKSYGKVLLLLMALSLAIGSILLLRDRDRNTPTIKPVPSREESKAAGNYRLGDSLAQVPRVPKGLFWYGSSIPFSPLHTPKILNQINQAHPDFRTQYKEPPAYTKPGSSTSVSMLLDGMVSFAELSRPLKDSEYQKARERGITLQQIPIASDGIVFFVNPALPVDKLTINQVRKMILGEITNWQQVGGPNLAVVPYVFDPKIAPSTLLLLFEQPELEQFSKGARYVRDYTDAIRKVSATPGSISYASAAIITNQRSVKPLLLARGDSQDYVNPFTKQRKINTKALQNGEYPLMRRFFIGVRRDGTIDEQAGLAYANIWLSAEGQELIEQAGFVPIK